MMVTAVRILEFDAAHRVVNHESKCATLHGHRYKVEIEVFADALDSIGRVIDFSVIKQEVGGWIDENWDHTTIVFKDDTETVKALKWIPHVKRPFIADWNPTAENMASFLLRELCPKLFEGKGVVATKVTVWETPNCKAIAI